MIDQHTAIISSTTGQTYYVRVLSTINRELLKTNCSIALHRYSHSVVDVLPPEADSSISMMQVRYYSFYISSLSYPSHWDGAPCGRNIIGNREARCKLQ
jgi:hypothetical protein